MNLLAGKNALITGAGANIGRAIALEMASQGASIYFAEKDATRTAALEHELYAGGTQVKGFTCDMSRVSALEEIVEQLTRQGVTIDILVNSVGVAGQYAETTPETFGLWQNMMDTNVLAPLYLSRLVAETMIRKQIEGSILFITSVHATHYYGDQIYSATKASLGMVINELAVSLAQHGIRVNGIAPGATNERLDGTMRHSPNVPLRHEPVRPCYIGRAAVFLASDYFSHCTTGATLTVDGGLSLCSFGNRDLTYLPAPPVSRLIKLRRRLGRAYRSVRRIQP
jgi:NAD(P)-dependent dehydrogenase (short-subunit alcohol dehydrogenase family)